MNVSTVKFCLLVTPNILDSSSLGRNVLQSTVLDGHHMHPDFDISVIKGAKYIQVDYIQSL